MTTGVHVDVILTCFFSCKDRASERYRPHQRKKKRLALCDLEAPGWGEPRFPHCAFVASWLTDCCMAFSWFVVRSCFILPYQSQGWYNVIISSDTFQMTMNWPADHRPCCFWVVSCFVLGLFVWVLFCFCLVFLVWFVLVECPRTVTAQWIMYRSYSVYIWCTLSILWCCHCINSLNLKYATGFPACLTTWREPYGVGRKNWSLDALFGVQYHPVKEL